MVSGSTNEKAEGQLETMVTDQLTNGMACDLDIIQEHSGLVLNAEPLSETTNQVLCSTENGDLLSANQILCSTVEELAIVSAVEGSVKHALAMEYYGNQETTDQSNTDFHLAEINGVSDEIEKSDTSESGDDVEMGKSNVEMDLEGYSLVMSPAHSIESEGFDPMSPVAMEMLHSDDLEAVSKEGVAVVKATETEMKSGVPLVKSPPITEQHASNSAPSSVSMTTNTTTTPASLATTSPIATSSSLPVRQVAPVQALPAGIGSMPGLVGRIPGISGSVPGMVAMVPGSRASVLTSGVNEMSSRHAAIAAAAAQAAINAVKMQVYGCLFMALKFCRQIILQLFFLI